MKVKITSTQIDELIPRLHSWVQLEVVSCADYSIIDGYRQLVENVLLDLFHYKKRHSHIEYSVDYLDG